MKNLKMTVLKTEVCFYVVIMLTCLPHARSTSEVYFSGASLWDEDSSSVTYATTPMESTPIVSPSAHFTSMAAMSTVPSTSAVSSTSLVPTLPVTSVITMSTVIMTTTSSTFNTTTSHSVLNILRQPEYLGVIIAGTLLIIIVFFASICCCTVCCAKYPKADDKKKRDPATAVHWSVEGGVTLLGTKDLAFDTRENNASTSELENMPSHLTKPTEKEESKVTVTVSSFGFPEVTIQPPTPAHDLDGQMSEAEEEKKKIDVGEEDEIVLTEEKGPDKLESTMTAEALPQVTVVSSDTTSTQLPNSPVKPELIPADVPMPPVVPAAGDVTTSTVAVEPPTFPREAVEKTTPET